VHVCLVVNWPCCWPVGLSACPLGFFACVLSPPAGDASLSIVPPVRGACSSGCGARLGVLCFALLCLVRDAFLGLFGDLVAQV